jgi:nicotinamide-nucleotide amidase
MFPKDITELTIELIAKCRRNNIKIATAESCTGGLIAGCLTSVSGSSDVFERGFSTYSNQSKNEMLGVSMEAIIANGAVSNHVAKAMCEGVLNNAPVQLTIAVTGIAGPGGGSPDKPVGTVEIASACTWKETISQHYLFEGDRNAVRLSTVREAIKIMLKQI